MAYPMGKVYIIGRLETIGMELSMKVTAEVMGRFLQLMALSIMAYGWVMTNNRF
jgi:hypothetical protein